jgi:drug/metabolite transporter (DMT)-like permease
METQVHKPAWLVLLAYLTIYIVWGSTYFFIKMAVETIPPLYVIGFRWFIGGLFILGFALVTGRLKKWPSPWELGAAAFLGILLLIGGNGLITIAEQKVDSYLAALIIASTPIVVAFFDWLLFKKSLTVMNLVGILAGVCGVGLLLYNGKSFISSFSPELLLVISGLISWAFATSLGHKVRVFPDNLVNSGLQMLIVGLICLGALIFVTPSPSAIITHISGRSWLGFWYLTVLGSLAFVAYTYLIANEPAIRIASYAFVNPVIAIFLGLIIGNETPVPLLAYGFPLILLGLFLMIYGENFFAYAKQRWKK